MPTPKPIAILHLSDLHFGTNSRFADANHTELGQRFAQAVLDELNTRQPGVDKPDLVIVTGDIAQTAHQDEYALALQFFNGLNEVLAIDRRRYIFTPGNHDVSWRACNKVQLDLDEGDITRDECPQQMAKARFSKFDDCVTSFLHEPRADLGHPLQCGALVFDFPEHRLSIAALNSCEEETHENHVPKISKQQAQSLMDYWLAADHRDWLKIATLHHNPFAATQANVKEWLEYLRQLKDKKELEEVVFERVMADTCGLDDDGFLQRIAEDCEVQLILHGHQHAHNQQMVSWRGGKEGFTPALAAGSLGLRPDKVPKDQPNQIQLVLLDTANQKLNAWFLVYDPLALADGLVESGKPVPDPAAPDGYSKKLYLPKGFPVEPSEPAADTEKQDTAAFIREYRNRLSGLYAQWDLKTVGVTQAGGASRAIDVTLESMYVPVRLAEGYDLEELNKGDPFDPDELLKRKKPLAIRGAAGSGKTTSMKYAFRKLLQNGQALPIMLELRRLVRIWNEAKAKGEERCLDTYIKDWAAEHVGAGWQDAILDALKATTGPRPILLVDGWDELGDFGEELRAKLVGFMKSHPHVRVIVTSRPYGDGRPSGSDGFEVLDIQPLSDDEIRALADHFFQRCYQEEAQTHAESLQSFTDALDRSPEATALGRTALLLTMMLLISRSSPLPDKRHQLYQKCIENLLTALPDRYEDQGVQHTREQWRPDDGQERFRSVATLAAAMQEQGYTEHTRQAIVLKAEEMAALLPPEWEQRHKDGFLLWLAERAGILVDRADGTFAFTHLSFQEFLTAWRFNTSIEGDKRRIGAFATMCHDETWWETLRLWAALIDAGNPAWLNPVMNAISNEEDGYFLVGAMLADDLGDDPVMQAWAARVVEQFAAGWPAKAEVCSRAWSASRQDDRKGLLSDCIEKDIYDLTWLHYLRCNRWASGAISCQYAVPEDSVNTHAIIGFFRSGGIEANTIAAARALCAADPAWPSGAIGLLNTWPGHRRLCGLSMQSLANTDAVKRQLVDAGRRLLSTFPFDNEAHCLIVDSSRVLAQYFWSKCHFSPDFACCLARLLARYLCSMRRWRSSSDVLSFVDAMFPTHMSEYLGGFWSTYLVTGFLRRQSKGLSCDVVDCLVRSSPLRYPRESGVSGPSNWPQKTTESWLADFPPAELRSYGQVALSALLGALRLTPKDPLIVLLAPACRLYHHPDESPIRLDRALAAYPNDGDPLWPALARHIARRSTDVDCAILEDLCKNPEAPEHPANQEYRARATKDGMPQELQEVIWGLKYIVRGDLLLSDGTELTLDQLADDLGMDRLPYLEPMPDHIEIDWDDDEAQADQEE